MADFWGPALDAELAYRHERLFTALRRIPPAEELDEPRDEPGDRSGVDARVDDSQPTQRRRSVRAARGWLLRGSETWHAAR
ncbi:hypothetical protein [Cellulomonas fengjieae]|uniref:Uncharacterized protein n=1 Tax=Cellulomonas fengjieae TaxID=2819978 RepID=A0ABS3SIE3_9CELL|nr:hypothetical protein [Cellulomonas fengjieae]MBO3085084.1 hypothetical protein [Cellulomonas fengjieae]MBO3100831.1 hypothetical protein [Cellulomonas fengjieae]QVI66330.1 hypothetical protein KG102_01555 [Cellulomonas fengjieae]